MAEAESWSEFKQKGNALYSSNKYTEAALQYTKAVDVLVSRDDNEELPEKLREELAKIYSNRSAAYFQRSSAETDPKTRTNCLEDAVKDGERCIAQEPSFIKGYYRCFDALQAQSKDHEAATYITKLLKLQDIDVYSARQDKALHSAMQRCRYYSVLKKDSPHWDKNMAEAESWSEFKQKGNALYSSNKYTEAALQYTKAVDVLVSRDDNEELPEKLREELAKIYSNRSAAYFQRSSAETDPKTRKNCLEDAVKDGERCIAQEPSFIKGYYRCFDALQAQSKDHEAATYITKLLKLQDRDVYSARQDKALHSAMQRCRYYSVLKKDSPHWDKVRFPDNCVVVDLGGAGDFTSIAQAVTFNTDVSVLVKPGVYKATQDTVIRPGQRADVIADVTDQNQHVTLYCSGPAFAPETRHLIGVFGGHLTLTGVTLRQESLHPEIHAICANMEAEVELIDVKGYSKMSACVAANNSKLTVRRCEFETCGAIILAAGSTGLIQHTRIRNSIRIGVELRDRAEVTLEDTEITNSGLQAVVSHAGAAGFTLNRCLLHNNARQLVNEGSAMLSGGRCQIIDTQITGNVAGGVMVMSEGHGEVTKCTITGGRFGLGFSLGGSAHIRDCKVRNTSTGVAIMNNLGGEVVLDNTTLQKCMTDVAKSDEDAHPKMVGRKYKVQSVGGAKSDRSSREMFTRMQKVKLHDKLHKTPTGTYDPRSTVPHQERVCSPCGLSQTTMGRRFNVCGACKMSWYCSKTCQKKDWPLHKEECKKLRDILRPSD